MNPSWRNSYLRYKSYFLNVAGSYKERSDIKAYLEILLSLVTVSIFGVFALRPTLLTIASLIQEIKAKQSTIQQMEDKIRQVSQAQSLYDSQRANIILLEEAIPEKPDPDVFARQIEGVASQHSLPIIGISTGKGDVLGKEVLPAEDTQTETAEEIPEKNLAFSGSFKVQLDQYKLFSDFISDFQKLRRLTNTETLNIEVRITEKEKSLIMILGGSLPYFPKPKEGSL